MFTSNPPKGVYTSNQARGLAPSKPETKMNTYQAFSSGTGTGFWTAPVTRDQARALCNGKWVPDAEYALRPDMGGLCKVVNGYYGLRTPIKMTLDMDARTITV